MAFIPLPYGIKVEVSWTTGGGVAVCVHYVSKTTPTAVTNANLINAMDAFDDWRIALRPIQAATCAIAGIRATDWSVPDGITRFSAPSITPNGSGATPAMPNNVAIVASHTTGLTGRTRRGRTYIGGLIESDVAVGDVVLGSVRSTIVAAYDQLRVTLLAGGLVQVVASFQKDLAPRVTGQGTAILVSTVDAYSDSQRRRLFGRGS